MPGFFEKTPSKLLIPAVGGLAALAFVVLATDPPAHDDRGEGCVRTSGHIAPAPSPTPPPSPCPGGACAMPA